MSGESKSPVDHAPGWNQDLASDSEAIVKGDQSSKKNPKQLQSETVQHIEVGSRNQYLHCPTLELTSLHRNSGETQGDCERDCYRSNNERCAWLYGHSSEGVLYDAMHSQGKG